MVSLAITGIEFVFMNIAGNRMSDCFLKVVQREWLGEPRHFEGSFWGQLRVAAYQENRQIRPINPDGRGQLHSSHLRHGLVRDHEIDVRSLADYFKSCDAGCS